MKFTRRLWIGLAIALAWFVLRLWGAPRRETVDVLAGVQTSAS